MSACPPGHWSRNLLCPDDLLSLVGALGTAQMLLNRAGDSAAAIDAAVDRVRGGDREAFAEIIEALQAPLRVVVGQLVSRDMPIDDLVQEAFISAYLRLDDYQLGTDFRAWIRTLARNIALNERRRIRRRRGLDHELGRQVDDQMVSVVDQLAKVISQETSLHLRGCLHSLAEAPRRVVEAFYLRGLDTKKIGEDERRGESWVRVVLFRARAALARCLDAKEADARG